MTIHHTHQYVQVHWQYELSVAELGKVSQHRVEEHEWGYEQTGFSPSVQYLVSVEFCIGWRLLLLVVRQKKEVMMEDRAMEKGSRSAMNMISIIAAITITLMPISLMLSLSNHYTYSCRSLLVMLLLASLPSSMSKSYYLLFFLLVYSLLLLLWPKLLTSPTNLAILIFPLLLFSCMLFFSFLPFSNSFPNYIYVE